MMKRAGFRFRGEIQSFLLCLLHRNLTHIYRRDHDIFLCRLVRKKIESLKHHAHFKEKRLMVLFIHAVNYYAILGMHKKTILDKYLALSDCLKRI